MLHCNQILWGSAQCCAMLHCNQIFTNTCEVMMQVKHDIEKTTLHKLLIYFKYMCLFSFSTLFRMIWCCFSKHNKTLLHSFIPYKSFYLHFKCSTFLGAHIHRNAIKCTCSFETAFFMCNNCLFYVQQEGIFINSLQL